jgi:hypothetical protein
MREHYRECNILYRAKNGYYNEALWKKNNRFKVNAEAILQKAVKMGRVEKSHVNSAEIVIPLLIILIIRNP